MIPAKPFESHAVQTQGKNFLTVKQKNSMFWTEVLFDTTVQAFSGSNQLIYLPKDIKIAVNGNDLTLPWSKTEYEVEGYKFILIPSVHVIATLEPKIISVPLSVPRPSSGT